MRAREPRISAQLAVVWVLPLSAQLAVVWVLPLVAVAQLVEELV
jgi:hypothetical protein